MLAEAADMETAAASAPLTAPPQPLERSLSRLRCTKRKTRAHSKESDPKPPCIACDNRGQRKGLQRKSPDQAFRELKQQHVEGVSENHHMDWIYWNAGTSSWCIRVSMLLAQQARALVATAQCIATWEML